MTRRGRILLVVALVAVALLLSLRWLAQPQRASALIAGRVGAGLGLEITAAGAGEYRLRGTPRLVLRDVTVREPGAERPLLRAKRLHVAVPWSTLRAGGDELTAQRIELDAPELDLPALQHWLATRPPTAPQLPTLTDGIRVRDGAVAGGTWRIDGIHADVPRLAPAQPLRARVRARYVDADLTIPVDLVVAVVDPDVLVKPGATGIAARGRVTVQRGDEWRLPSTVVFSAPLQVGDGELRMAPARLGMSALFASGDSRVPFVLGVHGPVRVADATWTLAPAGVALRGRGPAQADPVPTLDARGSIALGPRLHLQLDGRLARWPQAWPELPPPLGRSRSPLRFAFDYHGDSAMADAAALELQRDATRFTGSFRLPEVLDWIGPSTAGEPLPPIAGTLVAPELELAGARLEGVVIEFGTEEAAP